MLRRTLAQAASMGVDRIFLVNAGRVEKSFFEASQMGEEKLREALLLGLEQAMDTILPGISIHKRFRPFVEDVLPGEAGECKIRLVAHPGHDSPPSLSGTSGRRAIVAIGPEGGWNDFEIELFRQQGFSTFSLGARILRVDTAVPAILSSLLALREISVPAP